MGKILKRTDIAQRWGISLSTLEKRPDDQMPPRLRLPGSRLWMCREEDLLAFESQCVIVEHPFEQRCLVVQHKRRTASSAQIDSNKGKPGRPAKPPVSDRGRRSSGKSQGGE